MKTKVMHVCVILRACTLNALAAGLGWMLSLVWNDCMFTALTTVHGQDAPKSATADLAALQAEILRLKTVVQRSRSIITRQ